MTEEVRFCPLLTVVKAGQANYMMCQSTCVFFLDNECAFITTAKILKELSRSKTDVEGRKKDSEK
ncbi:TPA: hypothetical protein ENX78_13620 [Candidatus Poribacteria bacterium]|nr:hypothetical protein [Candidatus Poribacteria bacterium]